ncbi:hypothetical protein I7I53_05046 [Histoplasma capsulatum var. duboisii H88]|uniref:Uncharacterized protein n=1 Tax=Ajellomyces capsulatus (strain H88) TaxID=544711 RepID=A0A8A1LRS4_AJEC8|nr:hypothetical protein I7I53_05046 [Histoplasma capsulatum var. duboisii H88]
MRSRFFYLTALKITASLPYATSTTRLPATRNDVPRRPMPHGEIAQCCCLPTSFANFSVSSASSPSSSPYPKSTRPPISLFPEYLTRSILPVT